MGMCMARVVTTTELGKDPFALSQSKGDWKALQIGSWRLCPSTKLGTGFDKLSTNGVC